MHLVKVRYDYKLIKEAKKLFPENNALHSMMESGDRRATDEVFKIYDRTRVENLIDEDFIVKCFKKNKQEVLLDLANRSKSIRKLYSDMYSNLLDSIE